MNKKDCRDLKHVYSLILKQKSFSKEQNRLKHHLSKLVKEKISEINDLNDVINYWIFMPTLSQSRTLLEEKFWQIIYNYTYEEIQEIKRKKVYNYKALRDIAEKRKKEILPGYLKQIKSEEKIKELIIKEDPSTSSISLLFKKYTQLIKPKIEKIQGISKLIEAYTYTDKDSQEAEILKNKIKVEIESISDFVRLFSLQFPYYFREEFEKFVRDSLEVLLERSKNDSDLKDKLIRLRIGDVPNQYLNLVSQYL